MAREQSDKHEESVSAAFDEYAERYEEIHDRNSAKYFGEKSDYFVQVKVEILVRELRAMRFPMDGLRVLDVGCGTGLLEEAVAAASVDWEMTGVDISQKSLDIARGKFAPDAVRLELFDGEHLPFVEDSFDLVLAAGVFHHIPPEKRVVILREIRRVMRVGGMFMLFEHNPYNPVTRYVLRSYAFDKDAVLLSNREAGRLCSEAGIAHHKSGYYIFFPGMLRGLRRFEKRLSWFPMGGQFWFMAEKRE